MNTTKPSQLEKILQNTLKSNRQIPKDKYISIFIQTSLFLSFLSLGFFLLNLFTQNLPPELPLYYSQSWGKAQLASKYELLILPLSSLVVFFINFSLARTVYSSNKVLARILLAFSPIYSFLSAYTLFKIINLVT